MAGLLPFISFSTSYHDLLCASRWGGAIRYIVDQCLQDVLVVENVIGALKAYSGTVPPALDSDWTGHMVHI